MRGQLDRQALTALASADEALVSLDRDSTVPQNAWTEAFAIVARRAPARGCDDSSCAVDPAREGGEPWLRNDVDSRGAAKPVGFYGSDWQ